MIVLQSGSNCGSSSPSQTGSLEEEEKQRRRKRPSPFPSASDFAKEPPKKKKKPTKKDSNSATPPPPAAPTNRTIAHHPPTRPGAHRKGSGSSNESLGCNEQILEEEEGECSALQCLQPSGDQISWVQCDRCQEWFHLMCVGLTKEYAEQIDTYICGSCKQPNSCGVQTPASRAGHSALQSALQQLTHAQT